MQRKTWITAAVIVALGAVLAGGLYWRWVNSPRYALQQMALALETRNMDNFFKYMDLKEILNNFVKASSADLDCPEKPGADDWTKLTRRLGRKFAHSFLPKLFGAFEPQIRGLVEQYLLNLEPNQILGVAAAVTVAQIDTQGDEAVVTLTDPQTQEKLRLQMRRQPGGGLWQIVSVNYADLRKFYQREFQQ